MSRNYWEKREKEKLSKGINDIKQLDKELRKQYELASEEIQNKIAAIYMKYARDNNLTYSEATKHLSSNEFKKWKMGLKDYIKEIEKSGNEALLLELNTLATKSRITRLEEMLYQINEEVNKVTLMQHNKLTELLENTYRESYYKTIFDIQQFKGVGSSFAFIDKKRVQDVLSYPWSGLDYSSRIWKNSIKLKEAIKQELTQMIIQGKGNKEVVRNIAKRMDTSYKNAIRLVDTEHAYMMGQATKDAYKETELEQYQFLSTLDKRTSELCQKLDLKVFNLNDAKVGVNYPPMHVNCRSTTVPYFEDDDIRKETRVSRMKSGESFEVPSNMSYESWKEKYIDNSLEKNVNNDILSDKKWLNASFSNQKRFEAHFKHLIEYNNISPDEYLGIAREILAHPITKDVDGFISEQGWLFKYRYSTNDFAMGHPKGTISTLFKPKKEDYWMEQIKEFKK